MRTSPILLSSLIAAASAAGAQDAASILETMRQKQVERWEGVQAYVVDQTLAGLRTQVYYRRAEVKDATGATQPVFVQTTKAAFDQAGTPSLGTLTPEQLDQVTGAFEMTGDGVASEVEDGLEKAGLPRGLLAATGSKPWSTLNPRVMMGGAAMFLRAGAQAEQGVARERAADAAESLDQLSALASRARLVGTEKVDGRDAFHLRVDDLNQTQEAEGQEFTIRSLSVWVDGEEYVPLRFETEGVATSGGKSRPITIEKVDSDFRTVAGSDLYLPYKQSMRIAGMLDEKQQKELQEAQTKLAELEKQLEQMPEAQRKMIMGTMRPQMEMMRQMASGGGFQTEIEVHEVRILE
jgi:hypothetical protein